MKYILLIICLLFAAAACGAETFAPLSIRGTNYYPALTPWGDMWSEKTPEGVYAKDMEAAASLGVNTVRTFLFFDTERGYNKTDGTVTPYMLSRFEELLKAADKYGIKLIPCFEGLYDKDEKIWKKYIHSIVSKYRNDNRILMWDLMNEPGGAVGGPMGDPKIASFVKNGFAYMKSLDKKHLTTVGLCYEIYQLSQLIVPDTSHFHDYAPWSDYVKQGLPRIGGTVAMMRQYAPGKPVIVGEYGWSSHDSKNSLGTEEMSERLQASRYGICLTGYERYRVEGVLSWCLLDYPVALWDDSQRYFGCIRFDGSLKPSAIIMKSFYTKWAAAADYGYSDDCDSVLSWQNTDNCELTDTLEDDSIIIQKSKAGGKGVLSQTRDINLGLYDYLTVSVPELSDGASVQIVLEIDGRTIEFPLVKSAGVYEWKISDYFRSDDKCSKVVINAVLLGNAGCEAMWDRISIGNKPSLK